jgi:hypothetical protein
MPCLAVPCLAVPCHAAPCRAVPCRAMLRHAVLRNPVLYRSVEARAAARQQCRSTMYVASLHRAQAVEWRSPSTSAALKTGLRARTRSTAAGLRAWRRRPPCPRYTCGRAVVSRSCAPDAAKPRHRRRRTFRSRGHARCASSRTIGRSHCCAARCA